MLLHHPPKLIFLRIPNTTEWLEHSSIGYRSQSAPELVCPSDDAREQVLAGSLPVGSCQKTEKTGETSATTTAV